MWKDEVEVSDSVKACWGGGGDPLTHSHTTETGGRGDVEVQKGLVAEATAMKRRPQERGNCLHGV